MAAERGVLQQFSSRSNRLLYLSSEVRWSIEMRKLSLMIAVSLLTAGIATPALAHPDDGYDGYESQHDNDHDQLDQQHDDGHDYLDNVHREAHEEGLTPWEHRQLHRQLDREHAREHRQLDREHYWQHRRNNSYGGWNRGYNGWNGRSGVQFYFGF
ncbi:MAG: hypothetical protein ABJA20_12755 [Novosphingobium sp.]